VQLTEAGASLADQATAALNREVFADPGLDDQGMRTLIDTLAAFRQRAGDFSPTAPPTAEPTG